MLAAGRMLLVSLVGVCALASCKPEQGLPPGAPDVSGKAGKKGPVLAKVGGEVLTVAAFEKELQSLPEYTLQRMSTAEQKRKHLDKMIDEIILLQEAEKRKLGQDEEIQGKVERYRRRLITEKLYRDVASERSKVGEAEVLAYYQEHKDRFQQQERIRVRQILILAPPNSGPEKEQQAKKKAEEVLAKLKAGADFAELAKQYSEGPEATRGGDLGFFSRGRMVSEFEEAAFSLKEIGDRSQLVRSKFGFHILELAGRQPAADLALEDVRDRIVSQLESAKRREIRVSLAEELRARAAVEIHEEYFTEPPQEKK
jgi:peptidyl-prolyl cis-trans isomerase C